MTAVNDLRNDVGDDVVQDEERLVLGTMTGTSIDGLDAALISVHGRGLAARVALVAHEAFSFPAPLANALRAAAEQIPMTSGAFATLQRDFGVFHAECLQRFVAGRTVHLAALHGQTVYHAPPVSWQLLQAAPVVAALRCAVVCDLRQADLAAGGQGAPITPLADWMLFRAERDRAIVNLGGFCNATVLPAACAVTDVRGCDVCACNQVLDAVARTVLHCPFDANGKSARRGTVNGAIAAELRAILETQRSARRSLGTGDEAIAWVAAHRATVAADDLAASAVSAVGTIIGVAVRQEGMTTDGEILLAGGGARHPVLAETIAAASGLRTRLLNEAGVPLEAREAMEIAVLGALAADGIPISLAAATGRGQPAAADGVWIYPAGVADTLRVRTQC